MIKYRLRCTRGHEFETWFQNSAAFDKLAKWRQLSCITCGSDSVEKAMMAPRIAKSGARSAVAASAPDPDTPSGHEAMAPPDRQRMRAALKALRKEVIGKSENVGPRFAEEARRIHDDEAPQRGIYGEASRDEARALIKDGIHILPLPPAADDKN